VIGSKQYNQRRIMRQKSETLFVLSVVTLGLTLALPSALQAATTSWSATAPTVDGADIANFLGVSADADNILGGDDAATYIAANRPAQGQTFTTGNDIGYSLNAVTLQHVNYETYWSLDTGWTGYNGGRFQIQIGTIAAGLFTPIATEGGYMDAAAPANQNPGTGSAQYVSLTLDTPVSLAANSTYAFAVTTTADFNPWDGPYFELNGDGTTSANYSGGEAFSLTGTPGGGDQTGDVVSLLGDRVFHLDLTIVPEPGTGFLALAGIGILLGLRRRHG